MVKMDSNTINLIDLLTYLAYRQIDAVIMIYRTNTYQVGLINVAGGWISIALTSKLPNVLAQYIVYTRNIDKHMLAKIVQREWVAITKKEYAEYIERNHDEVYAARQFIMEKVKTMLSWNNAKIMLLPNFKIPESAISKLPPTHISEILDDVKNKIKKENEFKRYVGSEDDFIVVSPMAASILVRHPELDDLSWQIFLMVKTSTKRAKDIIRELHASHSELDEIEIKMRLVELLKLGILVKKHPREVKKKGPYSKNIIQRFISLLKKKL